MSNSTAVQQKPQGYVISPLNGGKARKEKSSAMPFEEALNRAAGTGKEQEARLKKDTAAGDTDKAADKNTAARPEQDTGQEKDAAKSGQTKEDNPLKTGDNGETAETPKQKKEVTKEGAGAVISLQAMMAQAPPVQVLQPEDINAALEQLADKKDEPRTDGVSAADQTLIQAEPLRQNTEAQTAPPTDSGQTAGREEAAASFRAMWQNSRKEIPSQTEGAPDQLKAGPAEAESMVLMPPKEREAADSGSDADSGFADMMNAQGKLAKAVREAGNGEETPEETADIEKLSKSAQEKGFNLMDRLTQSRINGSGSVHAAGKAQETAATPVLTQLKTGLEQGIKENLQEFTIKLKPEGLGEIVVHMASAGGKLTVDIGATSQETQKLINSQMTALKEMLEPLHAEVGSVSHSSQNAMEFMNFGQNQFQDQSRQAFGTGGTHGTHRTAEISDEEFTEQADRMIAESIPGRLYAYV